MKLVTFLHDERERAGALVDGVPEVCDLQAAHEHQFRRTDPRLDSVLAIIEGGDDALALAGEVLQSAASSRLGLVAVEGMRLCAPVPRPPQIRDCMCFEAHLLRAFEVARKLYAAQADDKEAAQREVEEKGLFRIPDVWYKQPIYYKANRFSVIGSGTDVVWPKYSNLIDFELEFGCYLKKEVTDVPREKARDYIFGYTIFNDFTARDAQMIEMAGQLGPAKGKDFDTGNAMGPCLVTADEIGDPYALKMIARVNGEEWTNGSSSTMHWKFEDLIAHISNSETIYPGEFIASGTVGGGCGLELERFLEPGDVVELEVEGIGVLRNKIVKQH